MMDKNQKEKQAQFWLDGSKTYMKIALNVYKNKYYDHTLFCGHLALEKMLKSMVVDKISSYAPHSHDLLYLAGLAKIDLDIEQQQLLTEINTFNIEGRYPEEKLEFHKRITKNYASEWLQKINEMYLWLSKLNKKN